VLFPARLERVERLTVKPPAAPETAAK
jgi:hypothetical protein